MRQSLHNTSLRKYNTFGIEVNAKELIICHNKEEIQTLINEKNFNNQNTLIIGGGSNLVFTKDFDGIIIHPQIKGISLIKEDDSNFWIEAGAGVLWDELVQEAVNNNWHGLENLSYIPGHVGASPIQNIGAYGVEAKDVIEQVKGIFLEDGKDFQFNNTDCKFGYRNSIFKNELKGKVIVTSVIYKLSKEPNFILSYGTVKEEVEKLGEPNLKNIRKVITAIRKSKLPEPEEVGNAGSFFKNPIIPIVKFHKLQEQFDKVPSYPIDTEWIKLPAGWLIEQAGFV